MIEVKDLTKTYRNGKGVFDLGFTVGEGEVFGYLGPNGAGKTTTIRLLLGFLQPGQGNCAVGGLDCWREASSVQKNLGYVPGEIAFFDDMTGLQFLRFMNDMRGLKEAPRQAELTDFFEMEPERGIRRMSKGMKQKLGLIAALMHDPEILILDEPTSGLDPLMQRHFIELIQSEKARGKTIFISSHNFEEVEQTCDRAGIIREGRIAAVEDVAALKSARRKVYVVTTAGKDDVDRIQSSGLEVAAVRGNTAEIVVSSDYDKMISVLSRCKVVGLDVASQSLEQVFMRYYGKRVTDVPGAPQVRHPVQPAAVVGHLGHLRHVPLDHHRHVRSE